MAFKGLITIVVSDFIIIVYRCTGTCFKCCVVVVIVRLVIVGFSGLVVPKFVGSNPAEAVEKMLSMPSFGGEVKPSVPCRRFAACKRSLHLPWKSHVVGKIDRPFLTHTSLLH